MTSRVAMVTSRVAMVTSRVVVMYNPDKFMQINSDKIGGVQQQQRSCRREKLKMSFVFFVLFQNTFKIHVFVPNLVKNMSSKKNKKDHDFCLF